jgi:hypothetical protein
VHQHRGNTRDEILLGLIAAATSIAAFLHYYRHNEILLAGDAVAHINIARRVFDSITPGPLQLGTVWLPLPHILTMPFVFVDSMWRTGIGGSIVPMIAYVAGTIGVYRLVAQLTNSRSSAVIAAGIFAANPNLLYMQATAMTESLYLALFIWTVVFATEWVQASDQACAERKLSACAITVTGALLTRYDGWFLAACVTALVLGTWVLRALEDAGKKEVAGSHGIIRTRALLDFVLLIVAVTGLWFAYNYREFGNATEFATGPYSAKAIERRTEDRDNRHHPGFESPVVASEYFLKAAKLNLGYGRWEIPLLLIALTGVLLTLTKRNLSPALLLWIPLPFYAMSIAYGGVPIFLPVWWPYSLYNARYGLELLPAVAVFAGIAAAVSSLVHTSVLRWVVSGAVMAVTIASYLSVVRAGPICLREARANGTIRHVFETTLARSLRDLPASARLLMSTGDHPGALERAGIPLRHVINETNHPQWERGLAAPAREADFVIALDDDDVAQSVAAHPQHLKPIDMVEISGAPRTTIYKSLLHGAGGNAR